VLIRFRVENHRSIYHEQELSLVASSLSEHPDALVRAERYGLDLLRVAAVYGANASGKSTLFDALSFVSNAVQQSHRSWAPTAGVPRMPFALDPGAAGAPSLFALDLLVDGIRHEYGFVVDSWRVLEEWLYAYPKGRRQEWFTRDVAQAKQFTFSRHLQGENRAISSLTRPNSLFLSAAAQNNHPMLTPIHEWITSNVLVVDEQTRAALEVIVIQRCLNDTFRAAVQTLLEAADLGVTNIELIEEDVGTLVSRYNLQADEPNLQLLFPYSPRGGAGVQLRHRAVSGVEEVVLPFEQESQGTRAMFSLAGAVVSKLRNGGVLVVDELDRSLHPHLASKIVSMFNSPELNPHNAQLIFNTHDTNLLDADLLRRDQIWFTEKGDDGATRLFPLTDFRARKYENLRRGYLQGRYGAVPAVGTPDLPRAAEG
jgi:energy-coupling factor transporter ATP-binding protein EcfA2